MKSNASNGIERGYEYRKYHRIKMRILGIGLNLIQSRTISNTFSLTLCRFFPRFQEISLVRLFSHLFYSIFDIVLALVFAFTHWFIVQSVIVGSMTEMSIRFKLRRRLMLVLLRLNSFVARFKFHYRLNGIEWFGVSTF